MQTKKGFYSVVEVCKRLSVSRTTLWRWVKEDKVHPVVPGKRQVFFRIKEIDRLWSNEHG